MFTTQVVASKMLKNSTIHLFDGNSDVINDCLRRHLRKLEKTAKKGKNNNANTVAQSTKLAFVIFFDNGGKRTVDVRLSYLFIDLWF